MAGPAGRVDVVLVCGGRWHDVDHARLRLLEALARHPHARTRVFEDYATGSAAGGDALARADLLVTYACDLRPDPHQQRRLADWVAAGGRWLALHGTNAAIDPPPDGGPRVFGTPRVLGPVAEVLGSQFLGHPPIAPYRVEVTRPEHPLVAGIAPFEVGDELYVSELHPPLEVLLHARFTGSCRGFQEGRVDDDEPRPVLYLKRTGAGTVCYLTLGHTRGRFDVQDLGVDDTGREDRGSWLVPAFTTVLERCLEWGVTGAFPAVGPAASPASPGRPG
ncbi:ThuA domain-containing protein [Modestobacter sp. I12A-02628]|uniref:ThuA domain-containing protein n=1 Tax=Goekera deserti TaxID=2497753 RepID=A0A7K3WIA9_9ACTN|nr:ThuA domain-containing protein [Goekera deserti]MPQ96535.1 ThuA domain-containing protein [Goekera deserti]NDI47150.1 ThuA domain-containing protein [Goekera deserti]NEL55450.1 ThuA domain-containing protein [Goekera deserti]